jgi:parallel beta-helix repeat protein
LRNIGNTAVIINGGINNGVSGCQIYHIGESALKIIGGDRWSLSPGYHYVENNHIYEYGRWLHAITAAVELYGVGHRIAHNLIHSAPHMAIYLSGNEHVIEFNEMHHVSLETGDSGAIYIGRDWTMRGNTIRYNYFHDIESSYKGGARPIYLDDCASGAVIVGNIFFKTKEAIFIAGGRDNTVKDNLFFENDTPIRIDARGLTWMKKSTEKKGTLYSRLEDMPYLRQPWSYRYPKLFNIIQDNPGAPKGNTIRWNLFFNTGELKISNQAIPYQTVEKNWKKHKDKSGSSHKTVQKLYLGDIIHELSFYRIPYEKIGLHSHKSFPQN